jgi:organic radical activating enzyme
MIIDTLNIAEDFYSMQGEGYSSGVPAYFIRLKACNLMCGGVDGSLVKSGEASWWCDTEYVWKKGLEKPFQYLVDRWNEDNILDWVKYGRVHLIWTGGEPTIPKNQRAIVEFMNWFEMNHFTDEDDHIDRVFNEIETNGTVYIEDGLMHHIDQINCSPKLSNSGMSSDRRIRLDAIDRIREHPNHWFKFVVSTEDCIKEIERDWINGMNICPCNIIIMPGLDKQKDFHERTKFCLEMGKKLGWRALTRLHVSAWDQTTGV